MRIEKPGTVGSDFGKVLLNGQWHTLFYINPKKYYITLGGNHSGTFCKEYYQKLYSIVQTTAMSSLRHQVYVKV